MTKRNEAADEGQVQSLRPVRATRDMKLPPLSGVEIGSYLVALLALWAVLAFKLLGALLAGMLVFQLVHMMAPRIERHLSSRLSRWLSVVVLAVVVVGVLAGFIVGIANHFEHDAPNVQALLGQAMQLIDEARTRVPQALANYLPVDMEEMKSRAASLVQAHAGMLQQGGQRAARGITHVLLGMIIGGIIAISAAKRPSNRLPLATALTTRVSRFADAFHRIVFAQIKISLLNTTFTAVFLLGVLPLFHSRLPLSKTLVLVTFVVGLLPVIGNLISNTLIVAAALTVSFPAAVTALGFLIVIHKLEYFLNARIVGGQIEARAWELLVAMLVMEAAFGVPGVIAAPIFYAYIKRELIYLRLI